jgi:hypothetical protein
LLEITQGSLEKVKAELKQVYMWKSDEIKDIKKQIKSWKDFEKKAAKEEERKENPYPKEFDEKISALEQSQSILSSVIPIRVGEIIVNHKLITNVLKKLKGYEIDMKILNHELIMIYKKYNEKGRVHLYDVSHYFSDFHHIPVAEASLDVPAA